MGRSSVTSSVTPGIAGGLGHQDVEEGQLLVLKRREGPWFARCSLPKPHFGSAQMENDAKYTETTSCSAHQAFNQVLPPTGSNNNGSTGFSLNSCSSCSFCKKSTCLCKLPSCKVCNQDSPARGWSARGPPQEIYKYI